MNPEPAPIASAPVSRRAVLRTGAAALAGLAAGGCGSSQRPLAPGERQLTVWHAWSGVMGPRFEKVAAAYERAHPGVRLRLVFTQNNLSTNQKFFTSVAAGTPPDVTFVDGPQVTSWAEWGALEPLTQRLQSAGIQADDYFPPTWRQNFYKDEVWGLTFSADPNFSFAWNREVFRKVGLNPEEPPQTIAQLTEMADRLTEVKQGAVQRLGLVPWGQYGHANSIFTWGWAFGGEFFDPAAQRITADHPKVVEALEWMVSFAKKYDPAKIASVQQSAGTADQNPFYIGMIAMQCLVISGVSEIERYAPKLDYGLTYIPAPPDGEQRSSWVGGWCLSMPKGARNVDDAWNFIHWLCHTPEGTATVGREMGIFPAFRHSPHFDVVREKKYYRDYVRILEVARHQRPVMPVQAYYMRELQRAVEAAVYGRKTPAEALAGARERTQSELDLALAGDRAARRDGRTFA